jgi:hypothetical protein
MPNRSSDLLGPVLDFGQKLEESLSKGMFVRLTLSGATAAGLGPERVIGRYIALKGRPHVSMTLRYPTRDEIKNVPAPECHVWVLAQLAKCFQNALLCTTDYDWQLTLHGKRPRLIRHKPSQSTVPSRTHDQSRESVLDGSAHDWLHALRVTDAQGKVRPGMADKHRQIERYLEIFGHLAREAGWLEKPSGQGTEIRWTIVDMGCGKGYLTFGLWHLCRRIWKLPMPVLGVETRPDLVDGTNRVVAQIGATDLQFQQGEIGSAELPPLRALIALHACDTATDDAILRGIKAGAELIVVAPCCHKEVRPQLGKPAPLGPVLRHGLMEVRMAEWATDGLRALYLEWAGYRTKVFEFVSSEHTPKNLMISAVRQPQATDKESAAQRIQSFKEFFGIQTHALDPLLEK